MFRILIKVMKLGRNNPLRKVKQNQDLAMNFKQDLAKNFGQGFSNNLDRDLAKILTLYFLAEIFFLPKILYTVALSGE